MRILNDGSLVITNLYPSDAGVYTCVAQNGLGAPDKIEYHLDITGTSPTNLLRFGVRVMYFMHNIFVGVECQNEKIDCNSCSKSLCINNN